VRTGHIAEQSEALTCAEPVGSELEAKASRWLTYAVPQTTGPSGFRLNAPPLTRRHVWIDGERHALAIAASAIAGSDRGIDDHGDTAILFAHGQPHVVSLAMRPSAGAAAGDGAILAPMPGKIIAVVVAAGQSVIRGQKLLTLEAMKMEHTLTAPFDGQVAELFAGPGDQVQVEALLARIDPAAE